MRLASALVAVLLCALAIPALGGERLVESVRFVGNRRIPDESLRLWVRVREGDPYSPDAVARDLRTILAQGFFADGRVYASDGPRGGVEVTFELEEYPIVLDVDFPGLSSVSEADVLEAWRRAAVSIGKESPLDPVRARHAAATIRDLLARKGRPNATVVPDVESISPTAVILHFHTVEGDRVRVAHIEFEGNVAFTDDELRSRMTLVKPAGLIAGLTSKDLYDAEKLRADLANVLRFYWSHGYLDAKVGEPVVTDAGRVRSGIPIVGGADPGLLVSVPIEEGRIYRVGAVLVEGATVFPEATIAAVAAAKRDTVVDLPKIQAALDGDLRRLYGDRGYVEAEANVLPNLRPDPLDPIGGVCDLTIHVVEGHSFTVGFIEFKGNTFTHDRTIRRELPLVEGEVYSRRLFDLSILRLNQLGYFDPVRESDADIRTNRQTERVDIDYRVQERGPQQVQVSGGGAGVGGSFVGFQYSTNNLLGYGESLAVDVEAGSRSKRFSFGFTEPYVLDRPILAGVQLFYQDLQYVDASSTSASDVLFTSRTVGGAVTVSTPLSTLLRRSAAARFARLGLSYSYRTTSIDDPSASLSADPTGTLALSYAQAGVVQATLTPTFVYSTVDGGLDPTGGQQLSLGLGVSGGPAGGDVRTIQPTLDYRFFVPFRAFAMDRAEPNVVALRVSAGHILPFGEPLDTGSLSFVNGTPFLSRYFLGGEDTIRGYSAAEISPLVPVERFVAQGNVEALDVSGRSLSVARPRDANRRTVAPSAIGSFTHVLEPAGTGYAQIGGDTQLLLNAEVRVPIAGPFSLAAFADVGSVFDMRRLRDQTSRVVGTDLPVSRYVALDPLGRVASSEAIAGATTPETPSGTPYPPGFRPVRFVADQDVRTLYRLSWAADGFRENLRSTVGAELRVQVPVVHLPVRLIFGYNPNDGRPVVRFAVGRTF